MKSMIRYIAADVPLIASVAGCLVGKRFALVLGACPTESTGGPRPLDTGNIQWHNQ